MPYPLALHVILGALMDADSKFMHEALAEARSAAAAGEVPIGAVRSCFEILSNPRLNHQVEVSAGVLAAEAAAILQSFFATRR